jgi:hypothetical protein
MKRDPDLARSLERALPAPEPPLGVEERVLSRVRARASGPDAERRAGRRPGPSWPLAVAVAALALSAVALWLVRSADHPEATEPAATLETSVPTTFEALGRDRIIELARGVRLLARAGARLEVSEAPRGTVCRLRRGVLLVHVPEGSDRTFEVATASARVVVTGTVFGVDAGDDEPGAINGVSRWATRVTVWEGRVRVHRDGTQRELIGGQSWPPDLAAIEPTSNDFDQLGARERVAAGLSPSQLAVVPDAGSAARGRNERRASRERRSRPATDSVAEAASDTYRKAQRLEAGGRPREAAALYELSAGQAGPTAEAAHFAAARLRSHLGEPEAARHWIETYRHRFPAGAYARAVDVLSLRAFEAERDAAGVEREAARFLERFSDDPRAPQFRAARALARARQGRCAAARSEPELSPGLRRRLDALCPD